MSGAVVPFQEEPVVENYFAGRPSEELYDQLRLTFARGSALMIVTGGAGSGKTMFCKKLVLKQGGPASVFFLDEVKSFGDVITDIADAFGITFEQELTGDMRIERICEILYQRDVPVLLVFDQAENLYLATLERIRRLYDSLCAAKISSYILFVGRPEFLDSYKQLVICNFCEAKEVFFTLGQLSLKDTGNYLKNAVKNYTQPGVELFSRPECIERFYMATSGNYRAINTFAREWLAQPQQPEAFIEKLKDTGEKGALKENRLTSFYTVFSARLSCWWKGGLDFYVQGWKQASAQRRWLLLSGAFLVGCGVIYSLSTGEDAVVKEEKSIEVSSSPKPYLVEKEAKVELEKEKGVASSATPVTAPVAVPVSEKVSPPQDEGRKRNIEGEERVVGSTEEIVEKPVNKPVEKLVEKREEPLSPPLLVPEVEKKKIVLKPEDGSQPLETDEVKNSPPVSSQENEGAVEVEAEEDDQLPVVISPLHPKIRFPALFREDDSGSSTAASEVRREGGVLMLYPLKSSKYRDRVEGSPLTDGKVTELERLVQNRFVAGMGWRNADKNALYTIRIAQVEEKGAEKLYQLFGKKTFRPMVADLYLFSKGLDPEYVVVFYGEFSTRAEAEKALQDVRGKFSGYDLSLTTVKDAMKSVHK